MNKNISIEINVARFARNDETFSVIFQLCVDCLGLTLLLDDDRFWRRVLSESCPYHQFENPIYPSQTTRARVARVFANNALNFTLFCCSSSKSETVLKKPFMVGCISE